MAEDFEIYVGVCSQENLRSRGYTGNKYARPISTKQGDDYIKVVKKTNLFRSLVQYKPVEPTSDEHFQGTFL